MSEASSWVSVYLDETRADYHRTSPTTLDTTADLLTASDRPRLLSGAGRSAGPRDIPVHASYLVRTEKAEGAMLKSPWWKSAVSESSVPAECRRLAELPFVIKIESAHP